MSLPLEITPTEVKELLDKGEKLHLIDVREVVEYQIVHIEGSELVPMGGVPNALAKLEAQADETPLIVLCHHGMRSLNVVVWLRKQGIEACQSMSGGIDRWAIQVDPALPRY